MSSSQELHDRLMETIRPLVEVSNIKQLTNWVWIVVGICLAKSIALSQIALYIPGEAKAESRVTRIRRWLMNLRVDVWAFYRPILEHILEGFRGIDITIILDGTQVFGNRWTIFRLSLVHKGRAIPIVWKVIKGKGNTQVPKLEAMLLQAARCLRPLVKSVTFLADRGFQDCDWASLCLKMGWHFDIRLPKSICVTLSDGKQCRIDQLGVSAGRRRYFQDVLFTQQAKLCAHLSVGWTEGDQTNPPEILAVMSDQPACRKRIQEYGLRMQIEESFKDDKTGGFDIDHTRLKHPERLERLLLAVAVATLWCHELGEHVLEQGEDCRRQIDPGKDRELSIFQLGLRWLKRCVAVAIHLLPAFVARLSPRKLKPVVRLIPSGAT
jgi:hypothetical protein